MSIIITKADLPVLCALPGNDALRSTLERAIVVRSEAVPPDVVTLYSRIVYADEATGERSVATLAPPPKVSRGGNTISVLAPIGIALLGASAGQTVVVQGSERRLTIEAVLHQPERIHHPLLPVAP